jgi:hypothetical protein
MELYDDAFVAKFLAPWNAHDVDGAMALMADSKVATKRSYRKDAG